MSTLHELVAFLGGSTILLGAVAWLAKSLAKAWLDKDAETLRHQFQRERDAEKRNAETAGARDERIRGEILRWANPILGAVRDLRSRLDNVLNHEAWLALHRAPARPTPANWSISYDYVMPSTLYLFASFFYWVRRLQEDLSFDLFESQVDKDAFLDELRRVGDALGRWPMEPACEGKDAQVFNLQQRALGAALTVRLEGQRCMGYDEFIQCWEQPALAVHLAPLRNLLEALSDDGGCRWKRLETVLSAVQSLERHCHAILQRPASAPESSASAARSAR